MDLFWKEGYDSVKAGERENACLTDGSNGNVMCFSRPRKGGWFARDRSTYYYIPTA